MFNYANESVNNNNYKSSVYINKTKFQHLKNMFNLKIIKSFIPRFSFFV